MLSRMSIAKPDLGSVDFHESPYIVIWEMTRSCKLRCLHCRAEAIDRRSPDELDTDQAKRLLEEIRRFGRPLVVLTGGDPMRRPDALELVSFGAKLGLRMAMTPSGTDEMTPELVRALKEKGLARLAVSLDGPTAESHDAFRQVKGSFDWTMNIIRWAHEAELPVQINTTITRHNLQYVDVMAELMNTLNIVLWSVFFLVPVGRGKLEEEVKASEYEKVFAKMAELSETAPFDIKSTEAPHYRRALLQRRKKMGADNARISEPGFVRGGVGRASKGVNDGNGFVFISHTGEIWPSGFLPLTAGNVKTDSLVEVYRHSALFKQLRDPSLLKGKCGVCEYKIVCGGSRARAYAIFGDPLEAEPYCRYVPKSYFVTEEEWRFW